MLTQRGKKIRLIENSVERTARMLSQSYGINVVWKAGEVKTDGKTIYLPTLPDDAPDDLLEAIQGYLDHETAHILFTDFKAATSHRPELTDEEMHCVNIVEDVRVEAAISQLFPGSPYNLRRAHEWLYHQLASSWPTMNQFLRALTAYFDYMKNGESEFWVSTVDPDTKDLVAECVQAAGDLATVHTTYDAIATGLRIFEVLKDYAAEQQEQREKEERETGQKKQGTGAGKSKSAQSQSDQSQDAQSVTGFGQLSKALAEAAKDVLDAQPVKRSTPGTAGYQHNLANDHSYRVYTTAGDTITLMPPPLTQSYDSLLSLRDETRDITSVLKTRFVNALRTQTRRRWTSGKDEGKLDARRLHRSVLGFGDNVYKQQSDKRALDTVVMVAVDHSGSMSGTKLRLAGQAAVVLGDALAPLKIPFAVYGYSTTSPHEVPNDSHMYARWSNLWIRYYRDFHEPWEAGAARLADAERNVGHNTLDGESVKHGIRRLLQRKEKRKILLVLNDGMPYPGHGDTGRCQQHLHDVVASAASVGVEIIAFGILDDSVKEYYPNHVVIHKLQDLVAGPLQMLDKMLRAGSSPC